jgi:hypothetical protein
VFLGQRIPSKGNCKLEMKLLGFLLLVAGWGIVLCALTLLPARPARSGFILAGVAVELLGLGLTLRSHMVLNEDSR